MRIAGLLLGIALSLAATGRAGDQDAGVSQVAPSKDDPPVETSSPKVKDGRNPDQPPARGPNPAKVEVIVFLDYENPNSARMRRAIRQLPNEFPGEVELLYEEALRQLVRFQIVAGQSLNYSVCHAGSHYGRSGNDVGARSRSYYF